MSSPPSQTKLEQQLLDAYGLLLSTKQLASFLGRTPAGLRWTLSHPSRPYFRTACLACRWAVLHRLQ